MRCLKLKVATALVIFSAFVSVQFFLLHPRNNRPFKEWLQAAGRPSSGKKNQHEYRAYPAFTNES